jgi:hypothetical protein
MVTLFLLWTILFGIGDQSYEDLIQECIDEHPDEKLDVMDIKKHEVLIFGLFSDLVLCGIVYGVIKLLEILL